MDNMDQFRAELVKRIQARALKGALVAGVTLAGLFLWVGYRGIHSTADLLNTLLTPLLLGGAVYHSLFDAGCRNIGLPTGWAAVKDGYRICKAARENKSRGENQ